MQVAGIKEYIMRIILCRGGGREDNFKKVYLISGIFLKTERDREKFHDRSYYVYYNPTEC